MSEAAKTRGRYERKVLLSGISAAEIELILKSHPLLFSEIHHQRDINNIYFDTIERSMYVDAGEGASSRRKIRVRWYGDLLGAVDRPVLEYKNKLGLVGWKDSFPMSAFDLAGDEGGRALLDLMKTKDGEGAVDQELSTHVPVLANRYSRRYFQSFGGHIRATIDTELTYYRVPSQDRGAWVRYDDRSQTVLEFKYEAADDDTVRQLLADSPFRLTKSSKYVQGIDLIYQW